MYRLQDIKTIHLEMTEKCNLSCLMCDRNINGNKVNPYLKNRELSITTIKKRFSPSLVQQLSKVYMCGNYGEPILAKDTMAILKYFRKYNRNIKLELITNGCSKPRLWWEELATIIDYIRFGIDGLCDTHKIYRQGALWDLIIRNAKAYIDAGGYAIWDFLVFAHNEHQIDEARQLSKNLGFKEFIVKKTGRFFSNKNLKVKEEYLGLHKPTTKSNINKSIVKQKNIVKEYGSVNNYLNKVKINCRVFKEKEIYISAEGIVLPCCWIAQIYKWYLPEKSYQIWKLINKDELNINKRSLKEIFNTNIFNKIEETWEYKTILDGKLKICAIQCGEKLTIFQDQYK